MTGSLRSVRDGVSLVEYPEASEDEANREAIALARLLRGPDRSGILDAIPAARTLLVLFDPARLSVEVLEGEVARLAGRSSDPENPARRVRIPVAYGGAAGPDLAPLARERGFAEEEFARRHASAEYRVAFIGFAPGYPYLVGLPEELRAPRLRSPRPRVAAGTVAIAAAYSGIYPAESPGGWRLIGRTSMTLFDPGASPPALLEAGDEVRFEAVREADLPASRPPVSSSPGGLPVWRVLSPGVFASVQGAPRYGMGSSGVPAGGAMDASSLLRANALLGNPPGDGALEIALVGPELEALAAATVAITGADLAVEWNGGNAPHGEPFRVRAGDRLRFGRARSGMRSYLSVAGGFETPFQTRRIETGDVLTLGGLESSSGGPAAEAAGMPDEIRVRVLPGPQVRDFEPGTLERLVAGSWRVSPTSDRRGLRLEGEPLSAAGPSEIPPEGAVFGSIQLPGQGLPIVLGPDGPVTGGYPKIATVVGEDLPMLGQAAPGTRIRFSALASGSAAGGRE